MAECDPSTRHKLQKTRHDFGRSAFIEPTRFQSSFTRLKKDLYNDDPFRVSLLCRNMYERHYYSKRKSVTSIPKERGDGVASSRSTDDDVKASHAPAPSSMDAAPQPAQPAQPALDNALDDIMDQLSGLSLSVKEQRQRSIQKQIDRRDHVSPSFRWS
ncbi:hypothetical protein BCR43DRAFT_151158 [Syncephalastrum racemosum]|uniref:Uncharacterized protein n=1 Tax=Syncephalastrum racemosum TaxID=13706 RepID=A0A1X2HN36_SYNRA|nr:hypothetical protein BCR43DRAFT_151158 [Syncephalastrum racemosum]